MIDLRQTKNYAQYMSSLGWNVKKIDRVYCYTKSIFSLMSVTKIQHPETFKIKSINKLSRKYLLSQFIFEPFTKVDLNKTKDFKLSKSPYLPSKTIHIDVRKSHNQLLKAMHQKTRYNIKIAERNGVEIKISNDIQNFAKFWSRNVEGKHLNFWSQEKSIIKLFKSFGKKIDLLIALKNEQLLGGILVPYSQDTAYYMYAAASDQGKRLHAPTLLVWEAIKLAKKKKLKVFDFEGIYDERFPLKSWLGFSKFKKTFGGQEVEYPGCFTKATLNLNIFNFINRNPS